MATLTEIGRRAKLETLDIESELGEINTGRILNPDGYDLKVPEHKISLLEEACDLRGVPLYHVAVGWVSTAETYTQLECHENAR